MNASEHAMAWIDVMRRCQQEAEEAEKAGATGAQTMMLGFASFAGSIAAAYRKLNEPR